MSGNIYNNNILFVCCNRALRNTFSCRSSPPSYVSWTLLAFGKWKSCLEKRARVSISTQMSLIYLAFFPPRGRRPKHLVQRDVVLPPSQKKRGKPVWIKITQGQERNEKRMIQMGLRQTVSLTQSLKWFDWVRKWRIIRIVGKGRLTHIKCILMQVIVRQCHGLFSLCIKCIITKDIISQCRGLCTPIHRSHKNKK